MKYIFSFFTLLVYIIVGFFHSPMVSFAMQENEMMDMKMNNQVMTLSDNMTYCWYKNDVNNNCKHECCFKSDLVTVSNIVNTSQESSKILKIKIKKFIDIYQVSINSFSNKNLINKTSPPIVLRDIKNYSYKDLIKIIKSNT